MRDNDPDESPEGWGASERSEDDTGVDDELARGIRDSARTLAQSVLKNIPIDDVIDDLVDGGMPEDAVQEVVEVVGRIVEALHDAGTIDEATVNRIMAEGARPEVLLPSLEGVVTALEEEATELERREVEKPSRARDRDRKRH